jgi:hypothetical protein
MFTKSTDQKAAMPEHARKVGGGTAQNTERACLVNTARGDHAEQPAHGRHLPQEPPDTEPFVR